MEMNSMFATDAYKPSHHKMLPPGTSQLVGNWTARSNKYAPKQCEKLLNFGGQAVLIWLVDHFNNNFFNRPYDANLKEEMELLLGAEYDVEHFKTLHKLGYLPIEVIGLPEGVEVPMRVATYEWFVTHDDFAWLPLYLETIISNMLWKPSTSATITLAYRRIGREWIMKTDPDNIWFLDYMFHDFSMRGMAGLDGAWLSGLGHAVVSKGSDVLPVIPAARKYYGAKGQVIASVPASEHSVSSACIAVMGELEMIRYYMKQYPKGILSIVSDTFDLWKLITEYLPILKDEIMAREGKIVIRPDSGNIVDIICGAIPNPSIEEIKEMPAWNDILKMGKNSAWRVGNSLLVKRNGEVEYHPQHKGVIELLWDIFGGTINKQGYKVLDPHIGAIYGDSVSLENTPQILERLAAKGFAATNIVLGVGSFTYNFNTRDTFGFAAKGNYIEIKDRSMFLDSVTDEYELKTIDIYKDPVTDGGTKKSAKGLIAVYKDEVGEYIQRDQVSWKEVRNCEFQTILKDGKFYNLSTFEEIRERVSQL